MAAIVQSNPYNCMIRKIGYSVGLELLLSRVLTLVDTYASDKILTYTTWNSIVTNEYKREKSFDHISNFFCTLNIIKLYQKDLAVLYGLDILSILRRYFSDDDKYIESVKFVLLLLLLESDGDILLNLMSASFEKNTAKNYLKCMILTKRDHFKRAVTSPDIIKSINSIIDIKQQKQSSSDKSSIFDKRTVSPFEVRKESLYGAPSEEVIISDDYLNKVPVTRKGWASDLGLFDNNTLTEIGRNVLTEFTELKLGSSSGHFTFWPYKQELASLYIKSSDIGIPDISKWDILSHLALIKSNITLCPYNKSDDNKETIDLIKDIYKLYKEGDKNKGLIRHQLPLYVLNPAIVAIKYVNNECIPDVPQILEAEYSSRERIINKINITGTEGALVIR